MKLTPLAALALATSCAGAHINPAPPLASPPAAAFQGPVIQPCVLLHQKYAIDHSMAVDEGGPGKVAMVFTSILVNHPQHGLVMIDPAVGKEKAKDFAANPGLLKDQVGDGSKATSLEDLLAAAGVNPLDVKWALITHAHFDHIGGATDIPAARIYMNKPDVSFADTAHVLWMKVTPQHEIDRIRDRIEPFEFTGPAYEGFPASFDLFGDGSIVGVPTPGHTPGSTSWFVNSGNGARWLFVGDAAWQLEGVSRLAHKGWMGRLLDNDSKRAGETLAALHELQHARPVVAPPDGKGIHIITGHDEAVLTTLPACAKP
jgi:glyoxylase-like metal-dependent hydrolase (beta-lactamase superfamily II)